MLPLDPMLFHTEILDYTLHTPCPGSPVTNIS